MADNPQQQFEKKVLISLETALKGVQGALNALKQMEKLAGQTSKSTAQLAKTEATLDKQLESTTKYVTGYNKSLNATKKIQKGMFETMRGIGGIARASFGIAAGAAAAYLVETKRIGQTMLDLQTQSLGAADSLNRLGSAYAGFAGSAGSAVVSLQDVAQSLAKFRSQGIAEMAASMNTEFEKGFLGMQDTLTRVLGKGGAASTLEGFYKSMGSEFSTFRQDIQGELRQLNEEFKKARDNNDTGGSLKALDALTNRIKELRLYTTDSGVAAQQVVNNLNTLGAALQSDNPTTRGLIAIHETMGLLGTIVENFNTKMLKVFGNDVGRVVDALRMKLKDVGLDAKGIGNYVDGVYEKFKVWGGVETLITKMNAAFDTTWEVLKGIATAAESFVVWFAKSSGAKMIVKTMQWLAEKVAAAAKWFIEASDGAKMFALAVAGITLSPGLAVGLASLVGGFKDLAIWAAKSAAATRSMNAAALAAGKIPMGGRAIGAKATGIGIGAAVAVGGHLGGRELAQGLGAEELGLADRGTGALGSAAGGAIAGAVFGPIGAAVGASVAALGSLILTGVQAWNKDAEGANKAKDQFKAMTESSERMTNQLRDNVKAMKSVAVSDIQKLRLEGEEILLKRAEIADQLLSGKKTEIEVEADLSKLNSDLDKTIGKRRQLGDYGTDVIDESFQKKIKEQEAIRRQAIEKASQGGTELSSKEIAGYESIKAHLEEAGKMQTEINRLFAEREQILSRQGTAGVGDDMLLASLKVVQEHIERLTAKQAVIEFGADPSKAIADMKQQFDRIASMQENMKMGIDIDTSEYEKSLASAEEAYNKLRKSMKELEGGQFDEPIKDLEKMRNALKSVTTDALAQFMLGLRDLSEFERTLPGFTESISGIMGVLDVLGPAAQEFGDTLAGAIQDTGVREMEESFLALSKSAVEARKALAEIEKANLADEPELARRWQIEFAKAVKVSDNAVKALAQSLEATLKPLEKQADLIRTVKDLRKLDLEISQQLYGTPALAVQAQLNLVQMQQREKEVLEAQLDTVKKQHNAAKAMRGSAEDIFMFKMKELELAKNIKQITADQLQQVKQLRDGYLDAVKAQALGAGKFSKIIISQEQNLMRGLKKGAMKRNYLLGQYAEDAAKTNAEAYRFSAQGQGILESTSGQQLSPQDIAKAVYDRVSNIADPLSKASALQSADILMNIVSGADKNTQDLGNIFMVAQDSNATQIVDAINAQAETKIVAGAAGAAFDGGTNPAGITAIGSAVERAMRGQSPPPDVGFEGVIDALKQMRIDSKDGGVSIQKVISQLESKVGQPIPFDASAYADFAISQGSAEGSIEVLTDYLHRQNKSIQKPAAGKKRIDPSSANKFFGSALGYYRKFIEALGGEQPADAPAAGQANYGRYSRLGSGNLKRIDADVKTHEKAHQSAAGALGSRPQYQYRKGADGKLYAVGGHVMIDASPIAGDPLATIEKMRQVQQAALAPKHPSDQDLAVAKMAASIERTAFGQLGLASPVAMGAPTMGAPTMGAAGGAGADDQYKSMIDRLVDVSNKLKDYKQGSSRIDFKSQFEAEFKRTRSELDGYLGEMISTVDKEGLEAVSNMQNKLIAPYTDTLKADLKSLGDMSIELESAEDVDKGELQAEIDKMSNKIGSQANLMRNIFGASGISEINDALSEFGADMKTKANKEVSGYEHKITELESMAQKAAPDIKQKVNKEIADLQSKISDIKIDFGTGDIDRKIDKPVATATVTVTEDESEIGKRAKQYGGAVQHLEGILGKKVDWGDMNLAQTSKVTAEAKATLSYYEKQAQQLLENKSITNKHVAALARARAIVAEAEKHEKTHQQNQNNLEKKKSDLLTKEAVLEAQVANMKLPLAEVGKLAQLEEQREKTGNLTQEQIDAQIPAISKIAKMYKTDLGKAELQATFGEEGGQKIGAQANNLVRDLQGIGTATPGSISRGGERLQRYAGDPETELKATREELSKVKSQEKFSSMPAQQKQMDRMLAPVSQIMEDAMKGFQSGGLGGIISGVQGGFENRKEAAEQQRISTQGDDIMKALKSSLSPRGISQSGTGKDARLGEVPTLQAHDTDAFMGRGGTRDFEEEMKRQFGGDRGGGIAKQARRVQDAERKLQKPQMEAQKQGAKIKAEALKKVRDTEKARLDKMTESARKSQPGGMTDAQFKRMDIERERVERAATDKAGTTYTGKAPERVKGIELPKDVVPSGMAGPPAVNQRQQLSGVSDPTKVRQLSHGATGNWQSKGRGVKDILKQAGQIIEEMGTEMDRVNSDQSNVTNQGYNRLFNVQPSSPS